MAQRNITNKSPGSALFPEYDTVYDLIAREVQGLTDEQLDWTSDEYEWARWSIRRQLSHMASLVYRWLTVRWADALFPDGQHGVADLAGIAQSDFDRAMDPEKYHSLEDILVVLKGAIELARGVMAQHDVAFLRENRIPHSRSPQWNLMFRAHPTGIEPKGDVTEGTINLEATLRHMYFEETTHLFNIQRLKRAQGLKAVVEVPRVGYWVIPGWDISEAV